MKEHSLTDREMQILQLIASGLTDHQIAQDLNITIHTANTHRKMILRKLSCVNVASMVATAFRRNLIR